MTFLVGGRVRLTASTDDGAAVTIRTLEGGDFLGQTTLTREPVRAGAHAVEEVTVAQIDREHIERLVLRSTSLMQELGRAIEERRSSLRRVLATTSE